MFYFSYLFAELRRRKGRTLITALGLGVGVGLVVTVAALSDGLDRAQAKVLEPLTGVGTEMTVTRALDINGPEDFANLSQRERDRLEQENGGGARIRLDNLGKPGEKFTTTNFMSGTQLSFDADEVDRVAGLDGVAAAAGGLTVSVNTISGTVPEQTPGGGESGAPPRPAAGGPPENIDLATFSVTGVADRVDGLGPVSREQLSSGRWLQEPREVVLNDAYAKRKGHVIGDEVKVGKRRYEVVGLVRSPLGGSASDVYMQLAELQRISDRRGRVNVVHVRADSGDDVAGLSRTIESGFEFASVTTAKDLADRVGGSLVDAKDLSGKLGTALTVVALGAAFLIAILLTLGSIAKRVRELGTLKAIGWPQRLVVRQVTMESVATGALGGVLGAAIGIGGAALISAVGPTLKASVAQAAPQMRFGPPDASSTVTSGSQLVNLDAPVDISLIAVAIGLALLGGLLAGVTGALRAARLRPADALRNLD